MERNIIEEALRECSKRIEEAEIDRNLHIRPLKWYKSGNAYTIGYYNRHDIKAIPEIKVTPTKTLSI